MNAKIKKVIFAVIVLGCVLQAEDRAPHKWDINALPHPDWNVNNIMPADLPLRVGGLDFFSDGRMAVSDWGGDMVIQGKVYILSNTESGVQGNVTWTEFADVLKEPLGVKVVNDEIYVCTKTQLLWLKDANNDGKADKPYTVISEGWSYPLDGNRGVNSDERWHLFNFGMLYRVEANKGYFYTALASEYPPQTDQGPDRGGLLRISIDDGTFEILTGGLRTPNGLGFGPEGEIFQSDNQGHYLPTNRFNNLRKGRFYAMNNDLNNPFHVTWNNGDANYTNNTASPAVWLPHGAGGLSPAEPLYLKDGVFRGQFLVTDVSKGGMQRINLERINGEYQGTVFHFGGGYSAGTNRIIYGNDDKIYVGCIGNGGENWGWKDQRHGLHQMVWKGSTTFEMLSIHSVGRNQIEIKFTTPLGTNAGTAGNWALRSWHYHASSGYGGPTKKADGSNGTDPVTVNSVTVSQDRLSAVLNVSTIPTNYWGVVVEVNATAVRSQANERPLNDKAWMTINSFGPADVLGCTNQAYLDYNPNADYDDGFQCQNPINVFDKSLFQKYADKISAQLISNNLLAVNVPINSIWEIHIRDMKGNLIEILSGNKSERKLVTLTGNKSGVYFLNFKVNGVTGTKKVLVY